MELFGIGAISSMTAYAVVYPFEQLYNIINNGGAVNTYLYRGILQIIPLAAMRGAAISGIYGTMHKIGREKNIPFWCTHLAGSGLAGIGCVSSNYIYDRMMMRQSWKEYNPRPRIKWIQIPTIMLYLTTYSGLRRYVATEGDYFHYFVCGGASGLVATSFNYPIMKFQYWHNHSIKYWMVNDKRICWNYMWTNKLFYKGASWSFWSSFVRSGILFSVLEYLTKKVGDDHIF